MTRPAPDSVWKQAGLPPGTLVHVGEQKIDRVRISRIRMYASHSNTQS